jgi:hypothetical protein
MRYVVTAGYVSAETAVPGGRATVDIRRGALLPEDVPVETVEALLGLGHIEAVTEKPAPEPAADPDPMPDGPIPTLLAWVGDDLDRAQLAFDAEQAKGDGARKGVVDPLTELLTRPGN